MLASPPPPSSAPTAAGAGAKERNASPSPSSRQGASGFLSSFGARLSRTFSRNDEAAAADGVSEAGSTSPLNKQDRSVSRGREALQSTGRGGFGNIRQASVSRDRSASGPGPDDFSTTRGREREPQGYGGVPVYSTGRGGAGNLRSPSREPKSVGETRYEKEVIDNYTHARDEAPVSTGRGGLGNIAARSRSREPSAGARPTSHDPKARHAVGRGGAGNIREGDGYDANAADEVERGLKLGHAGLGGGAGGEREVLPHSTGRGGIANITEQEEPAVERPSVSLKEGEYRSAGRGGSGNLVRN